MLHIIEFIIFLIYTILIFFIKNYLLLGIICFINIVLMIILKQSIRKALFAILKIMPFIIFTSVINMIMSEVNYGILIGLRLILVCNITYIFSRKITPQKLQYVIETILKPLRLIKIDSREIGIIVCIGVTFIPIIQKEIEGLKYSLKSKGFKVNLINIIRKPNYILIPLITSIIKRVGEIESSLYSKGYAS